MLLQRCGLLIACLLALFIALPAFAQDDDEDPPVFNPEMQWKFARAALDRREYDEARALLIAYAEKNPDEPHVLEAWWESYLIYRDRRKDKTKQQETYEKAMAACERWLGKYAKSKPERAAQSLWFKGLLFEYQGNRPMGIATLTTLVKTYPDAPMIADVYWYLSDWLRESNRPSEAIPYYAAYRKLVAGHEYGARAAYYEGLCYEKIGDKDGAILAYKSILEGPYNWRQYHVHWHGLYASRQLKALGEPDLARRLLIKIIDVNPPDADVTKQAYAELGEKPALKLWVYPNLVYTYTSSNVSIDARTKLDLAQQVNLLVRPTYVEKNAPFKGTFQVTPKLEMSATPKELQPGEDAKVLQATIAANAQKDFWFNFTRAPQKVAPPDSLVVTRKWTRQGNTWGEFELRIQSSSRWHIWIYLPNNKTNANNINLQPHEVRDGGKTLRWYDQFDLKQGMTIKFPIEVGGNVAEYYPKIVLEHEHGPAYPEKSGNGTEGVYDMREMGLKLTSEAACPYTFSCRVHSYITLDEVSK